jgi:hypothetical protein
MLDAIAKGHEVDRRRLNGEYYEYWNGDFFKHGFLFKDVRYLACKHITSISHCHYCGLIAASSILHVPEYRFVMW